MKTRWAGRIGILQIELELRRFTIWIGVPDGIDALRVVQVDPIELVDGNNAFGAAVNFLQ